MSSSKDRKFTTRSTHYRQNFFKYNKPAFKGKYFCSYCGALLHKKDITVDHLVSINSAKKKWLVRKYLMLKGYKSINDVKNLVPACERCNKRKGKKQGLWVIRGILGRNKWFWVAMRVLLILIVIVAIYMVVKSDIFDEVLTFILGCIP